MSDALGTALVLGGTFLAALGYVLQKRAHIASEAAVAPIPQFKSAQWLAGLACMVVSALLVVASAPFLDQSKQAPLGAATLVFNSVLATFLLGEKFLVLHLVSTITIITGSLLAVSANSAESKALSFDDIIGLFDSWGIGYSVVAALIFGISIYWIERTTTTPEATWTPLMRTTLSILAPAIGGASNGWVGYSVKALTTGAANLGSSASKVSFWVLAALAGVAVFSQVRFLNKGLAFFSAQRTVPVFQCGIILSNSLAGIVYFHDLRLSPSQLALFFFGAGVCVAGILMLLLQEEKASSVANTSEHLIVPEHGSIEAAGLHLWEEGRQTSNDATAPRAPPIAEPASLSAAADHSFLQPPRVPFYLREVSPLLRGLFDRVRGSQQHSRLAGGDAT